MPTRQKVPLLAQPGDISPDDLLIVQKRQDWRYRVARICLDVFENTDVKVFVGKRFSAAKLNATNRKYTRIADYVKRDLRNLLVTGVAVNELEAVRYQVNYFLEEVIHFVRSAVQNRAKTRSPLEGLSDEEVETEVKACLERSPDSLVVFIDEVVKLAELEIEADRQRQRIRLLLGGDRKLAALGNNEAIMTAKLGQLWPIIEHFFDTYDYVKNYLPPLLETESPYPDLESELKLANEQLQELIEKRVDPFHDHFTGKRDEDAGFQELDERLRDAQQECANALEVRVVPLAREARRGGRPATKEIGNLDAVLGGLGTAVERLVALGREVSEALPADGKRLAGQRQNLLEHLDALGGRIPRIADGKLAEIESPSALGARLEALREHLGELLAEVDATLGDLESLRAERVRTLREQFCTLTGELRTFLQTGFAHIAAKDPRSTESSYHFFLREFSNEAHQAILLLREIRELEVFVGALQQMKIAGLPLTPENLARILRVLFLEKDQEMKRIPSGEGWKVLSAFLLKLKDDLVPRLQRVCALDGIRFEDKNNLSEWANQLTRNCTLCIAQHEIGYSLVQEMGRIRDEATAGLGQTHIHIVTTRTCNEMQASLKEICMTLTATIPYIGIMKGGIERRASIFFHRQQKLLEPEARRTGETAEP